MFAFFGRVTSQAIVSVLQGFIAFIFMGVYGMMGDNCLFGLSYYLLPHGAKYSDMQLQTFERT